MKSTQTEVYIPRDDMLLSWDPENMDKYWSQCEQYDRSPLGEQVFDEGSFLESKSVQLFNCFKS